MLELAKSGAIQADLASAFEASPNPYMLLTPDLLYAGMNQAYLEAVQRTREELLGRSLFQIFDGGPGEDADDNSRQLRASLEKVLATRQSDHLALIRYAIPARLADGSSGFETRCWSATHTPICDETGALTYILQHTVDITELERLRAQARIRSTGDALSALDAMIGENVLRRAEVVQEHNRRLETERNRLLDIFMQAPGFMAVLTGPDHVFQMHNAAYGQLIGHRSISGKTAREALPELEGQGYFEFLDDVFATGEPYEGRESRVELQRVPGAPLETVFLDFIYQPIRDHDGRVAGVFVQGHDVTETVLAAERQKLMIDELNHRVKNTLATVQSIAMQTARTHADPRSFAESFQSRLMSLSHTHDLLTRSHWEGADLRAILEHETAAHGQGRLTLNGPPAALGPAQALSLGMVFHELATNAAKYGALSNEHGRIMIDWTISHQNTPRILISWRETGGPAIQAPERKGFGSRLIERNIRHDLAGELQIDYAEDGFKAEISFPLDGERAA